MKQFAVATKHPYNVIIGSSILPHTGEMIRDVIKPCRACVITDSTVNKIYAQVLITSLIEGGFHTSKIVFPAGEHAKNITTYSNIIEALADEGLIRSDIIIGLGGGVVGDLAGFSAATYMRGVRYVQVPTTLLSAIDASVGGKTSVNLPSGKNLAGAFWQPSLVVCDYDTFDTLAPDKLLDGVAEAVKCAAISESALVDHIVARNYPWVIERCVSIKKSIIEADERDTGVRQLLSFGHTVGHGIEKMTSYAISHGQAVADGMVIEAKAAYNMGLTDVDISGQLQRILSGCGFTISTDFELNQLYKYAVMDKKINEDKITMVIPEAFGKCKLQKIMVSQLRNFIKAGLQR